MIEEKIIKKENKNVKNWTENVRKMQNVQIDANRKEGSKKVSKMVEKVRIKSNKRRS